MQFSETLEALRPGATDPSDGNQRHAIEAEATELRERLREANERAVRLLESIDDGFILLGDDWRFQEMNGAAERVVEPLGRNRENLVGRCLWDEFPELRGTVVEQAYRRVAATREPEQVEIFYPPLSSWFQLRVFPAPSGLSVFFRDISWRKDAEAALDAEKKILALLAAGASLCNILDAIAREVETRSRDGMLCSVLLLDPAEGRLLHGAAPSLDHEYNAAIDGLRIGPGVGSCGTAAFEKQPVCVTDIATDPKWAAFTALAARHRLAACTSHPILSSRGEVLGTIAMYYRESRAPSAPDQRLIGLARDMAAIAIERHRAEEALHRSEEFTRRIVESSGDCIKTLGLDGTLTWVSEKGCRALCIDDLQSVLGSQWIDFWEGEDRERARAAVEAAAAGSSGSFVGYFAVKSQPRWWNVQVTPMCDATGRPVCLLAVSRDVTDRVQAESALREREERLRLLVNMIPQLAWMARADGHIFWYNEGWYSYTGTTPEEMEGWGWQRVHDPAILPLVTERWKASISSGTPFEMEFPIRRADGAMRWFLTRVNPLRNADGEVTGWFGTNTDIDDVRRIRQALEEETRMLELLNQTGIALASNLELHALLQKVTDSATQLSGAQFGAFFYNTLDEKGEAYQLFTLAGAPREAFEKLGRPRATPVFGPTFRGEGILRSDDITQDPRYGRMGPHHGMPPGHLPVRSYLAVPVASRTGEVIGGLFFGHPEPGVFTARTEKLLVGIAAQAAVAVDNARLFDSEQRASRDRENLLESERYARAEAERASRMKDEFLATLSHELRTPLGAIMGWAHLLRQKQPSREELEKGLETIERNARLQSQLIDDLLDMSRITSGKLRLELQELHPRSFIEAAVETVRPAAEAKGVRVEARLTHESALLYGDHARLQQVVWNLLTNAIKFSPHGGCVEVATRAVDGYLEIAVKDEGIGIEPGFMEHLFERFRQADASTTRRFGGLGLGLSIVKQLVDLHGGTVSAASEGHARGSTFTIRLPLHWPGAPAGELRRLDSAAKVDVPPRALQGGALRGTRVLVVDDQADVCELVRRVLHDCGAVVATAGSAAEALELYAKDRPDILVSDIGMPAMDGYELLARVQALDRAAGREPCAVAMTAFARPEDQARAMQAGFRLHIAKPVHPSDLLRSLVGLAKAQAGAAP